MAGPGSPTTEQEIVLDIEGRPVLSLMQQVEQHLTKIQGQVKDISGLAGKSAADMDAHLRTTVKALQTTMGQLKVLQAPGANIQSLNNDRSLARQTVAATDYARTLTMARNAAEGLQGKINDLNRTIAAGGASGQGATIKDRDRLKLYEQQLVALKALETQQERNQRKLASGKGGDLTAELKAFEQAQARLSSAAMNPNRVGLSREITAAQVAQDKLTEAINRSRTAQAALLNEQRRSQSALVTRDVRDMVSGGNSSTVKTALLFEAEQAARRLREAESSGDSAHLAAQREALALADRRVRAIDAIVKQEERELSAVIATTRAEDAATAAAERRMRLADEAAARLSGKTYKEYAVGQAAGINEPASLDRAREASAMRLRELRQQAKTATGEEANILLREIDIEKAIGSQLERNLNALKQQTREREKAAKSSAGPASPNILPAGGLKTVFARTAAYALAGGLAYGAFSIAKEAVTNTVQLEDEFVRLQAISNTTDAQMQSLKTSIFDVAATSRYATVDLIKISQTLAQAGVSAADMTSVLKSVTTLATASGSTPDEAVQLITSALGAFQLQIGETGRVADLMTSALNRTKLTVQQTAQAIQYVGATAYEQNITLEQMLATIGAVSQAGIKSGSTIGTGFRQFLVDLQTPSEKLTAELAKFNLTAKDVDVSTRGLPAVLDKLKESGFGASSAYAGLETRAAAFYLVAKNNTRVMDDLQMAFTQQGAAATANDRAMNSVTAQWQRLKNIMGDSFAQSADAEMGFWARTIKGAGDAVKALDEYSAQAAKVKREKDLTYYKGELAGLKAEGPQGDPEKFQSNIKYYQDLIDELQLAAGAQDELATASAKSEEAVSKHEEKIVGLTQELERLYTQQDSIRGQQGRVNVETVSLTTRFEGLAKYLANTALTFDDLTSAMKRLRGEEENLMSMDLLQQRAHVLEEQVSSRNSAAVLQNKLLRNPGFNTFNPAVQTAIQHPTQVAGGGVAAGNLLLDTSRRLESRDPAVAADLRRLAELYGVTLGKAAIGAALDTRQHMAAGRGTTAGSYIENKFSQIPGQVAAIGNLPVEQRAAREKASEGIVNDIIHQAEFNLKRASPELKEYFTDVILRARTARDELQAAAKASQSEARSSDRASRTAETKRRREEADARRKDQAETRDAQTPLVSRSDVISIAKQTLGTAIRVGSGVRSVAEQDDLHRRGKTKATGATSAHSRADMIGQDFPTGNVSNAEGLRMEQTLRRAYRAAGLPTEVKFESGEGSNNGTGKHLHTQTPKGSRRKKGHDDGTREADFVADLATDKIGLRNADKTLQSALSELKYTTTSELFDQGEKSAKDALAAWSAKFEEVTLNQAANEGLQGQNLADRVDEMRQTIAQKTEDVNTALFDALLKNVNAQLEAAQTAFEDALKPSQSVLTNAQAQVSGLEYESNRGKVPEFVTELAQRRAARASEDADRSRSDAIPGLIADTSTVKMGLQAELAQKAISGEWGTEKIAAASLQISTMTKSIADLVTEKQNLDTALGAGGLVPTTLSEGLDQAIQSFRDANNVGRTFNEEVIMNMSEGINTLAEGFTTMFMNIANGTQSVLGAMRSFVTDMIKYMIQLAVKAAALKIFNLLLSAVSGGVSRSGVAGVQAQGSTVDGAPAGLFFNGGTPPVGTDGLVRLAGGGGRVSNGNPLKDSVNAKIAKDEWVVRQKAVQSVGHPFMAKLNKEGAGALDALRSAPTIVPQAPQETNVWVVKPDTPRPMGKNDVLLVIQDDILSGGETKKLIRHVTNGG
jgi:TP901 family phage tail tape measure protein